MHQNVPQIETQAVRLAYLIIYPRAEVSSCVELLMNPISVCVSEELPAMQMLFGARTHWILISSYNARGPISTHLQWKQTHPAALINCRLVLTNEMGGGGQKEVGTDVRQGKRKRDAESRDTKEVMMVES